MKCCFSAGFAELGMTDLATMEDIAPRYLVRFRQMSTLIEDDGTFVQQSRRGGGAA